jgi:hypothetical protein
MATASTTKKAKMTAMTMAAMMGTMKVAPMVAPREATSAGRSALLSAWWKAVPRVMTMDVMLVCLLVALWAEHPHRALLQT